MKSYVVLVKPFGEGEFFAAGANLGFRDDVGDLAIELSGEDVDSLPLGGELLLIGPLEAHAPRQHRFAVSRDGHVRKLAAQHDRLSSLEELLLRALHTYTWDWCSEHASDVVASLLKEELLSDDDAVVLEQLLEEERADRQ